MTKPKTKTAKAAKPARKATKTELLTAIGKQLDIVDAGMSKPRDMVMNFEWPRALPWLTQPRKAMDALKEDLDTLLNPDGNWDDEKTAETIKTTFTEKPGIIPRWARPGTFLLWLDYIPVCCQWGGFADPTGYIFAVDPKQLWIHPSGVMTWRLVEILPNQADIGEAFRDTLISHLRRDGRKTMLHQLDEAGAEATRKTLEAPENAWLREALQRGPIDPVPLPAHLQAVQQSLFA